MDPSQEMCSSNSVALCWSVNKQRGTHKNDNFRNSFIKLLYLTTNSVVNKSSHLTFNIHASWNKAFTCKTNTHISPKVSRTYFLVDILKIFLFVTADNSAVSIISENIKINSPLLTSASTRKNVLT